MYLTPCTCELVNKKLQWTQEFIQWLNHFKNPVCSLLMISHKFNLIKTFKRNHHKYTL